MEPNGRAGLVGGKRRIWGDVNAALNRLVADGVIAAFKASFSGPAPEMGAYVIVTPVERVTDLHVEEIRSRVESALADLVPATVILDRSPGESRRCNENVYVGDVTSKRRTVSGMVSLRARRARHPSHARAAFGCISVLLLLLIIKSSEKT